jgi:hypothetical protein
VRGRPLLTGIVEEKRATPGSSISSNSAYVISRRSRPVCLRDRTPSFHPVRLLGDSTIECQILASISRLPPDPSQSSPSGTAERG